MGIDFLLSDLGAAAIAGALSLLAYLGRRFVLSLIQGGGHAVRFITNPGVPCSRRATRTMWHSIG